MFGVTVVGCGDNGVSDPQGDSILNWKTFVRDHYSTARLESYVRDTIAVYSGFEWFDFCGDPAIYDSADCWDAIYTVFPLAEEGTDAFYEQIGVDDKFVFGWDDWSTGDLENPEDYWVDWNPYSELPDGIPKTTPNRQKCQQMRH
jgi:hypothetical protein